MISNFKKQNSEPSDSKSYTDECSNPSMDLPLTSGVWGSGKEVGADRQRSDVILSEGSRIQLPGTSTVAQRATKVANNTGNEGGRTAKDVGGMKRIRAITNSDSSVAEVPALIPEKMKQGRLATTGLGVGLKERKAIDLVRRKEEESERLEREAWDLLDKGMFRSLKDKRPVEEVFRDPCSRILLRETRSSELASEAGRALGAVRLVARRFKTLKGTFVSLLNRAVATSEAVLATLLARTAELDGRGDEDLKITREVEELREELRELRTENRRLEEELRVSKASMIPALDLSSRPLRNRRRTYAETVGSTTSTEEEKTMEWFERRRKKKRRRKNVHSSSLSPFDGRGKEKGMVNGEGGRPGEMPPSYDDNLPDDSPPPTERPDGVEEDLDASMATTVPTRDCMAELDRLTAVVARLVPGGEEIQMTGGRSSVTDPIRDKGRTKGRVIPDWKAQASIPTVGLKT
ncbi:hypothetical protein EAI_04846 [Harpegnathos saltator]|uniref:Gag-like protein n=1 Tax=Harpegnathos saltator TaxID=610380 RepID=E2BZS2_HARSA|nr:hypothetical protein EAI_04846 [Harpegnathos saltator]